MSLTMKKSPSTIREIELAIESGLEQLRNVPLNEQISLALRYLVPPGRKVNVQLEEDGRKKRSTAAASNWSPELGEVVIYSEPLDSGADALKEPPPNLTPLTRGVESAAPQPLKLSPTLLPLPSTAPEANLLNITSLQVQQCCEALAEAEKAGKLFIALKWFRDEALPSHNFDWTASADTRQRVLAAAIEGGAVQTKRIPNPKSALHPTTTISLSREIASRTLPSRFNPIPIAGEPVSETILRDRGSL